MELIKILSSTVIKNIKENSRLLEAMSEKVIGQMIGKFSGQTDDSVEIIRDYISDFERFKQALPTDKRNIQVLDYNDLKSIVDDARQKQETKKASTEAFKTFMEKNKGADINQVKANFKAFDMIKDILPPKEQNITKYTDVDLNDLIQNRFVPLMVMKRKIKDIREMDSKLATKLLSQPKERMEAIINQAFKDTVVSFGYKKFVGEDPELTPEMILPRLELYANQYSRIPFNTKPLMTMSFDEFEHIVDALPTEEGDVDETGIELGDIEKIYEDDKLLIFLPTVKNQCIRLRKKFAPNTSWCTSWDKSGNLYYNYRLNQNLTLYYVVDLTQPANYRTHPNHAGVILVDKWGDKRLADATNSGRWSGSQVVNWSEIEEKFPLLRGKESLFKPLPLSDEDQNLMNQVKNFNVQSDAIEELGSEANAELWLELVGPDLSSSTRKNGLEIYANLSPELKKKYISLSLPLNSQMVENSEQEVVGYYLSKKVKEFENKSLEQLTEMDIALINHPMMKRHKEKIRANYTREIELNIDQQSGAGGSSLDIIYPRNINAKFAAIFGLRDLFASIKNKDEVTYINLENTGSPIYLDLPNEIAQFTKVQMLIIDNMIKSIPEAIGQCRDLVFLNILNCPKLTKLPRAMSKLSCLQFLSITNSGVTSEGIPESAREYFIIDDDIGFITTNFPESMKKNCPSTFDFD
jgi:hypothetical protein